MRIGKLLTYVLLLGCLLASPTIVQAHGGYHSHNTKKTMREWRLKDNKVVKGWFVLFKNNKVLIEQPNGSIFTAELNGLSTSDVAFVLARQAKTMRLNQQLIEKAKAQQAKQQKTGVASFIYAYRAAILYGVLALLAAVLGMVAYRSIQMARLRQVATGVSLVLFLALLGACKKSEEVTTQELLSFTTPAATIQAAFAPYTKVTTTSDANYVYVSSDQIPEHEMMKGITAWIAQVPTPQVFKDNAKWSIPLSAKYAESPISLKDNFQRGAVAIAANGIPIFNPLNASGLVSNEIGELDAFGGHSGRADDYHYHTAPLHLEATSGTKPIAYAFDGFAIYGSKEPDGSTMTSLDEYQGHLGSDGVYHYHGTTTYPYVMTAMRGEVSLEGTAPQNQISPQPSAIPIRQGDPHPIKSENLVITSVVEKAAKNGYVLSYTIGGVAGSVDYSWDTSGTYTFIFNDVDGKTTTETWKR